jgi:hypothetical protein
MGFRKSQQQIDKEKELLKQRYPELVDSTFDPTAETRKDIKEKILDVAVRPDSELGKNIAERRSQERRDAISKNAISPELMNKAYDLFPSLKNIVPEEIQQAPDLANLQKFETKQPEKSRDIAGVAEASKQMTGISKSKPATAVEDSIETPAALAMPTQDEQLLSAQQLRDKLESSHGVSRAFSRMLQKVAGTGPVDVSAYDQLIKGAESPVKDVKEQREQEEVLTKLQTDKAKADPNSPVSKMARDSLSEIAGIAVPEGTSLKQLEVIYPYITQAMNTKAAREDRAFARQQLAYEKEQRRQEKQDDKNYTFVQNLRKEMGQGEGAKVYGAARKSASALAAVKSAISSPSGYKDLMNTYNLGKIADPDSAVREGELKLFGSVGSIPQRMRANFAKFVNGELNDKEQRKAMLKVIEEIHKRNLNDYKNYMKPIYKQADAMGVDREMLDRSFEMEEEQKPSSNSDIHQKAYEWAKANPNDPKAKQILERQGRK